MNWDDIPTEATAARCGSDEFETLDEAICAALAELAPGGRLDIHQPECASDDGAESTCTCIPETYIKGAQA